MTSRSFFALLIIFGIAAFVGCSSEPSQTGSGAEVEAVELEEYETFVAFEDNLLGSPYIARYDGHTNRLLVYDDGSKEVLALNGNGEVTARFGGEGQGPGELEGARNIFVMKDYIYIVDSFRYFIHKYNRSGEVVSSMDFGVQISDPNRPAPPRSPIAPDIYHEPFVTLNGNVMLSSLEEGPSLYKLQDWEGNHLADIGEIPEAGAPAMDDETYRTALENREVPRAAKRQVFPVADKANPDELFLIYGAIPKIAKYDTSGQKLWEKSVPDTPEVDTLVNDHYRLVDMTSFKTRWPLRKYVWGTSSSEGDLYLAVYTNLHTPPADNNRPLWIHRFNPDGELVRRYKMVSKTDLLYYPAVDATENRFFVLPFEEGEVWAYPF